MLLLYPCLDAKLFYTHKKTLVVRYELKFLFHKEILDPIKDFPQLSLNFPFSHVSVSQLVMF